MNRLVMSLLCTAACQAIAQTAPTTFPAESVPLAPAALQETLAGQTYTVKLADGANWRWQFNSNGYFFFNSGGFSDTGKWSTKESALCSEGKKIAASCNEVRQQGADLYLKRDNGDVVKMTPQ
jgi:hypothetical protein